MAMGPGVVVTSQTSSAIICDQGRPGYAALGVGRSGAWDRVSYQLANRLVGNRSDAAAIEVVLGGFQVLAKQALTIAVTGAPGSVLVAGAQAPFCTAVSLPAGCTIELQAPIRGLRSYLAIRGGIDAPVTLGSRSTDTLAGLGPQPLAQGQEIMIGRDIAGEPDDYLGPWPRWLVGDALRVIPGPRANWFTATALATLVGCSFQVSPDSDRIGVRLTGPPLARSRASELKPEGMLRGAIQVPPSGLPLILGPDHPVTGGYPVIAVVCEEDCDQLAQVRPGDSVRFSLS
jgi:biotin-dependent carboxylase-like uncharacterized protein